MPLLLVAAFIAVPIVELLVIGQVARLVGLPLTLVLLLVVSVAGAWLVRREGPRAWQRLLAAIREGRVPTREVTEGALILLGGALMLTPGFVTDAVGLLFVVPPTRAAVAAFLQRTVGRRVRVLGGTRRRDPIDVAQTPPSSGGRSLPPGRPLRPPSGGGARVSVERTTPGEPRG